MTKRSALATLLLAFVTTTELVPTQMAGAGADLFPSRLSAHAAASNEAIAWSSHTAEVVNVGLTVREHTIVNVAMFEAANTITQKYRPYALHLSARPGASVEAAVATAAYRSLEVVWPREAALWKSLHEAALSRIPSGPSKTDGMELGTAAAEGILALRAGDVPLPGRPYPAVAGPGRWRPNTPELTPEQAGPYRIALGLPALTAYVSWTPWALKRAAQFRPPGPPALTSAEYARDVREVQRLGAYASRERTAEQTREARFYMVPAPRIFGPFAHGLAARRRLDVTDSTRLFALLSLALMDAQIACFDAKWTYQQWRPLAAIRESADDGNPATIADPGWIPVVPTPPFPDYPAAHSCSAGAASVVLAAYLRPDDPLVLTSPATGLPAGSGDTRRYASLTELQASVGNARVWAGVHFRHSTLAGNELGRKVGQWVTQQMLRPADRASR